MSEKEKRRKHRKEKRQSRKARTPATLPAMPSLNVAEQVFQSIFSARGDPRSRAQDLAYEAMDAPTAQRAQELARQALELNPRCVDALLILARTTHATARELIDFVAAAVQAGEEDLGRKFFRDNRGYFWGILETRPYMRARAFLAELLAEAGELYQAVEHLEAMLELNPNDNQGLRYVLLGHYLTLDRLEDADRLLQQYDREGSAMFAWGRVLQQFLTGNLAAARASLAAARQTNRFAEDYLVGRKRLPRQLPEYYAIGDQNEGIVCAMELGTAWAKHPDAIAWVKAAR